MSPAPLPLLIATPHAATHVPEAVRARLMDPTGCLPMMTDRHSDRLFDSCRGAIRLTASVSRLVVDLNRAPDDDSASGVIPRLGFDGQALYRSYPTPDERRCWLDRWHHPYHGELLSGLTHPGIRLFLDGHSMRPCGPPNARDAGRPRPDFVIGNLGDEHGEPRGDGQATSVAGALARRLVTELEGIFADLSARVALNRPFAGGYTTERYAQLGFQGIQLEINEGLYMRARERLDEPALARLQLGLARFAERFCELALG